MESTSKQSAFIIKQLQGAFAFSILILLASSYASFYSNKKLIETSQWVNHTNDVIKNSEALISTVVDAETGQRGYLITDDASFLQPYNGAYEKAMGLYKDLKVLTKDNEVQQQNLEKVRLVIDQRFTQMQRVIKLSSKLSQEDRMGAFTKSSEEMNTGRVIMQELRGLIAKIKIEEKRLLDIRITEQEKYTRFTPILVVFAALMSILISVVAYFKIKADLDARILKQKEDEALYLETSRRIVAMEQVTQSIASGDYTVRSKDEAKDELGKISTALNDMVAALENTFNEIQKRNWLQTGMLGLSNALRGERFTKTVSQKIINNVAAYLNAPVGTIYLSDKNLHLKLQAGYAITNAPAEISAGDGLLGQVVRNKELFVSDELPEGYLSVTSSVGQTCTSYLIILPLLYDQQVIAVLEIGLLRKPVDIELNYLRENAESLAIAINSAINFERMQDLLEETQAQSEELQSQHTELENINSELETQTEKLQASEEELRVQQEELQQANQELEERSRLLEERNYVILERNMEVQRKAEELAQSTKYKSEFLANMSHELRTPLNSILLLSRLLAENNDQSLTNDQVEYARVIQSSGNGLLVLIDEILDLSKIEAGKMSLEYDRVSIVEISDDMKSLFEPLAKEKGIGFTIEKGNDVILEFETDKLRLEQVLKNLLSNALKFTSEGGVILSISNTPEREGFINFAVQDSGIGIPEDKQMQIFEAFQQADGSTRRKYGGTGLGLSISKELVKLLGGDIVLSSDPGKGSLFVVTIPVSKSNVEESITTPLLHYQEEETEQAEQKGKAYISDVIPEGISDDRGTIKAGDKIILIVEDDINFAKSLLEFTRKKGYKGIVSVRGDDGLEMAKKYLPTGILLDVQLPVKSGLQVIEELKSNIRTRPIPVHIMSSHSLKKESLMKGAVDFINKPIAFEQMHEIFNKLEHVLSRKSKKVLIVEDNPKHAKALAYFLETFNINSDIKNTIDESIEALRNEAECVILDMGIPDNKAYDTLEEIKKNPELEGLPIIVFTGKSLSLAEEHRIKQYADSIIVKTAHSYQRILDEVSIFLHLVEENKQKSGLVADQKKMGVLNDVLKRKTVLIVDDDVRNIFSLTKALERVEMNIVAAIDGKEAIEKMRQNPNIDIVLLDMMMPRMDGYETAKKIRENRSWKNLPVIAVTAKAMNGDREKCINAGASDYITKPVDIDQLLSLLRVWLYDKSGNSLN